MTSRPYQARRLFLVTFALIAIMVAPLSAQDQSPTKSASKDAAADKATKEADDAAPSLDDLLKLPGADKKPSDPAEPKLEPQARAPATEAADAFQKAIAEMAQAADRLRVRQDPGITTQRIQESVLSHLDAAIEAAKKQQQQQQQQAGSSQQQQQQQQTGSKQNQQQQQQQQANQATQANPGQFSPGQATDPRLGGAIEETRVEWGSLPQRLRDELEQGLGEKFSPIYQKLTEAFYKRLAEEGKE